MLSVSIYLFGYPSPSAIPWLVRRQYWNETIVRTWQTFSHLVTLEDISVPINSSEDCVNGSVRTQIPLSCGFWKRSIWFKENCNVLHLPPLVLRSNPFCLSSLRTTSQWPLHLPYERSPGCLRWRSWWRETWQSHRRWNGRGRGNGRSGARGSARKTSRS